jgi:hypothetical protein
MTSFAGNMVATNVIKTTKVNKIVKANEARSPDVTGMQNTSKFTKLKAEDFDSHVTFQSLSAGVDLQFTATNSQWSIIATSSEIFTNGPGLEQLNYKLTLKRHSKFIFLNLVLPIILLETIECPHCTTS